jgi:glycosyltransferase involved in cell wall biosynthesis
VLEPLYLRLYHKMPAITVSVSGAAEFRRMGFSHMITIPNGYDGPFLSRPKKKQFCFVARLVRAKGVAVALDAFEAAALPGYTLVVCGEGPLRPLVEERARRNPAIQYLGRVSAKEKARVMAESLALLFPSVREGFGLTAIEAAAAGTPTIGTDVTGLKDTIGHNGIRVPDQTAMTQAIQRYATKRPSVSVCHAWVKRFDWKMSDRQWLGAMQ